MLNPSEIDPLSLPSVALEDRRQLPTEPCIYFAIDSQGTVQYVGRSVNPRNRWKGHHRYSMLKKMEGVRIAYFLASTGDLAQIESYMISKFKPYINCYVARQAHREGIRRFMARSQAENQKHTSLEESEKLLQAICDALGTTFTRVSG